MAAVAKIHKQNTNFKFHNLFSLTEQIIYIIDQEIATEQSKSFDMIPHKVQTSF